jgi:EAL domain-containing protein (putative c-di-GMP-specific phosphodiesterase class I)
MQADARLAIRDDITESLRVQRNMFMAFAFAGGHLLMEIAEDGTISFATGAKCGLVERAVEDLVGQHLVDLAPSEHRDYLAALVRRAEDGNGVSGMRVVLEGPWGPVAFRMGARRLPEFPKTLYASFSMEARKPGSERVAGDAVEFSRMASDYLSPESGDREDIGVTVLALDGIAEIADANGAASVARAARRMTSYLKAMSSAGEAVGRFGDDRFALVTAPGVETADIMEGVREILRDEGVAASPRTVQISFDAAGLEERDAVRALAYAVRTVAEDPSATLRSVAESGAVLARDAAKRIAFAREMLASRSLEVAYQPIVRIDTGKVAHFEALARVSNVDSIAEWVRFAEESGFIEDLDLVVAQQAMDCIEAGLRHGWRPTLAVNVSARSLSSRLFRDSFHALLSSRPNCSRLMMIELTETAGIGDLSVAAESLSALRNRGIRVCLDDVGSGATSLESIRILPADFLKIDGSLTRTLAERPESRRIVQTVCEIARARRMAVVGEHIETQEQARMLRFAGVQFGQGWLYGRPGLDVSTWRGQWGGDDPE